MNAKHMTAVIVAALLSWTSARSWAFDVNTDCTPGTIATYLCNQQMTETKRAGLIVAFAQQCTQAKVTNNPDLAPRYMQIRTHYINQITNIILGSHCQTQPE